MRDFFKEYQKDDRDYLILGKGPSLDNLSSYDVRSYITVGLNHVCRDIPVEIAHIIDVDVLDGLGEKLLTNCKYLLMPYYPHMGWRPHTFLTLQDLCLTHPVLSKMTDRIYGYNLSTSSQMINKKWNDSPIVWASYFSAEAVVNLLGRLGVKRIRTIGVDGGKGQAEKFKDLQNININGYDAEWPGIRKSIGKFALDYAPLGVKSPIRIFIGAGEEQIVPALVLRHSILKHATMSVEVTIMNEWTHPMPKDPRNRPRTPFSFQRFMIPEKCDYKGHAIYMDSDMLVFGDVKEIWQEKLAEKEDLLVMRNDDIDKHRAKYSVFVMDCSKLLQWGISNFVRLLDQGYYSYEELMFDMRNGARPKCGFNTDWNSIEEYTEDKTKLLHYTEMYNQPWLANPNHPLGHLWFAELKEAIDDGSIDRKLIEDHVGKRWILPKCLEVLNG